MTDFLSYFTEKYRQIHLKTKQSAEKAQSPGVRTWWGICSANTMNSQCQCIFSVYLVQIQQIQCIFSAHSQIQYIQYKSRVCSVQTPWGQIQRIADSVQVYILYIQCKYSVHSVQIQCIFSANTRGCAESWCELAAAGADGKFKFTCKICFCRTTAAQR